jgi:hypothetical protein
MQEEEQMFIYNKGVRGNILQHVILGKSAPKVLYTTKESRGNRLQHVTVGDSVPKA